MKKDVAFLQFRGYTLAMQGRERPFRKRHQERARLLGIMSG